MLVAARIAPATRHIGLVPVATVTHTEPFHISKAIATLDYISRGRAGWQPRVSGTAHEAALFGRRNGSQSPDSLFDEAADAVEVVRRLWDSWEDDAVIRDVSTGRYIDRNKLHYIDFAGKYFSVKGPSITPRPPQGQPVVATLAHAPRIYEFASASSDLVFITPTDDASVRTIIDEVQAAGGSRLKIFADVVVTFGGDTEFGSDALIFDGSPAEVVDLLLGWQQRGIAFGHVAINAAAAEFRREDFAESLLERLHRAGVPPRLIQIEVTETVFLGRGAEYVERALKQLSAAGMKIALDDFGTGFASLSHLQQFPVDTIKIDRRFVEGLGGRTGNHAIINAVLSLGRSLGMDVVAEGIETAQQEQALLMLGCQYGQGFLYSRAVPARIVPSLVEKSAPICPAAAAA